MLRARMRLSVNVDVAGPAYDPAPLTVIDIAETAAAEGPTRAKEVEWYFLKPSGRGHGQVSNTLLT